LTCSEEISEMNENHTNRRESATYIASKPTISHSMLP
jgi:hypothetical protein